MLKPLVLSAALLAVSAPAGAMQSGRLGGLLGGGLPDLGSIGMGNAAGLLGYCIKNDLLAPTATAAPAASGQSTGARAILERLAGRQGVQSSPGYAAGQAGRVQTGAGALPIDDLGAQLKGKLCKSVLKRARAFL